MQQPQQFVPASGSTAPPSQNPHLYPDSLISPYIHPSQNPNLNSFYGQVQPYYSTGVSTLVQPPPNLDPNSALNLNYYANTSSNEGAHQLGLSYAYIQSAAAAVAQDPSAITQHYAAANIFQSVKTNQFTFPQKRTFQKNGPKKIKILQLIRCEICDVDCNSQTTLQLHNIGSKHKKNMQKLGLADPSPPAWCEVCKVQFNSNIDLDQHKLGKYHKNNAVKVAAVNSTVPLAWCEVCQENYNSKIVLEQHKVGRKHLKNLEKLTQVNSIDLSVPTSLLASASVASQNDDISEDLETKKKKVIQGGAAPQSVCMCPVCNVVCNSVEVFKFHLSGKKHLAMMQMREAGMNTNATTS